MDATKAIVDALPGSRILVFTRHAEQAYLNALLRAGAAGCVLKQSRAAVLVGGIRSVASGVKFLDPAVTATVIEGYRGRLSPEPGQQPPISGREEEILRLVGWGQSNKEIAAQLDLSVKTVESHKANAMLKLGLASRIDVVRYALLRGWLREE